MPVSDGSPLLFKGFDKLVHLGFFFVLSVLLFYGRIKSQNSYKFRFFTILKIIVLTAAIGAGIEIMQLEFFSYRSAEFWDFGCDMLGVMMAVFSYILLHRTEYNDKKS
jgi:VanZ family protein